MLSFFSSFSLDLLPVTRRVRLLRQSPASVPCSSPSSKSCHETLPLLEENEDEEEEGDVILFNPKKNQRAEPRSVCPFLMHFFSFFTSLSLFQQSLYSLPFGSSPSCCSCMPFSVLVVV